MNKFTIGLIIGMVLVYFGFVGVVFNKAAKVRDNLEKTFEHCLDGGCLR